MNTFLPSNPKKLAVIALGTNLRGSFASIDQALNVAIKTLNSPPLQVVNYSELWRSKSWPVSSDPSYLNAVAIVQTELDCLELLRHLQDVEARFGRERGAANAPRTLDLDLIDFGGAIVDLPELILPHPRAAQRLFVMGPLAQIWPDWRDPASGKTASELAATATVGLDAQPIDLSAGQEVT